MSELTPQDARALAESWLLRMAAERKSEKTLKSYREGINQYIRFCAAQDGLSGVVLRPDPLAAFTVAILDRGLSPATARLRQLAVRRFSGWLASEGEIPRDELLGVKPPRLSQRVVRELDADEIKRLLKECDSKTFSGKRDEAIIRLMVESGARCDEIINQNVTDIDLARGSAVIRKAKGGKARVVPFGPSTGSAIDRYLRARRHHKLAGLPTLWLGERNNGFTYDALYRSLKLKAARAGVHEFHPHVLRHTFATRWLDAGGSEGGLMTVAGWSRREMIETYTRSTSQRRAADEARRLGLGEL